MESNAERSIVGRVYFVAWVLVFCATGVAQAAPDFVEHIATSQVYGEATGVTMRQPAVPREDQAVDVWIRIGYSFYYTDIALYYTTDGSEPAGSFGVPSGTTAILRSADGGVTFIRNEPHSPDAIDWWKATLPAQTRVYNTPVKYKVGVWYSGSGAEVFANNYGCSDGTCDDPAAPAAIFAYTVKLAWPGKGDIDNHQHRLDILLDRLGPIGLGAEQIAPSNSLLYPSQTDFVLQAAWPNAWESMSFFVDAVMMFFDWTPDALGNTLRIEPKLPTGWPIMTVSNLRLGSHRLSVTCSESSGVSSHAITNTTGNAVNFDTVLRVPVGSALLGVTRNDSAGCQSVQYTYDAPLGRVRVTGALDTGAAQVTTLAVRLGVRGDFNGNGHVDLNDVPEFIDVLLSVETDCIKRLIADLNGNGVVDGADIQSFVQAMLAS